MQNVISNDICSVFSSSLSCIVTKLFLVVLSCLLPQSKTESISFFNKLDIN